MKAAVAEKAKYENPARQQTSAGNITRNCKINYLDTSGCHILTNKIKRHNKRTVGIGKEVDVKNEKIQKEEPREELH